MLPVKYDRIVRVTVWIYGASILQRGGRGMERGEPKPAGATLKNFFVENSRQTPISKIYIFLTFMHHNAADWTCNYTDKILIIIFLSLIVKLWTEKSKKYTHDNKSKIINIREKKKV